MKTLSSLVAVLALVALSLAALPRPAAACWECDYVAEGNVYSQCSWAWFGGSSCVESGGNAGPYVCAASGSCYVGWFDPEGLAPRRLQPIGQIQYPDNERFIEVCVNSPGCWYKTDDATEARALRRITEPWGRTTILYRS